MKDISIYFQGIDTAGFVEEEANLLNNVEIHTADHFPELKEKGVALIYCPEYRSVDEVMPKGTDAFRKELYKLFPTASWNFMLYDLGNLLPGEKYTDTFFALSNAVQELIKKDIVPVVVGGSQDLTYALYKAYEDLEQFVNLTTIDAKLDLGTGEGAINKNGWLSHIVLHQPNYLFNYSNLGCQAHYNPTSTFDLFEQLFFDVHRLGVLNSDITLAEPVLRNTDILSLDVEALRASELNSASYIQPNGFFANEICRLARYAGVSDKLSSFGIFNLWGGADSKVTDALLAQVIWYFVDGYAARFGDFPIGTTKNYLRFKVYLEEIDTEINFLKSDKSGRWWMEVPYPQTKGNKYVRHHMVPCSYQTYQDAMQNEIPDLWWSTYQKLS